MYKQITIKTLEKQGKKKKEIAEDVGCHRNTVRNIVNRKDIVEKQTRQKPSYFDKYKDHIKNCLNKEYTRIRIYEILQDEYGIDRTYDCMCKYIQKHFPKQTEAFGVQQIKPGEEAEIDFGYLDMLPNGTEGRSRTYVFAVKLSFSRKEYYEATPDQKISTVISALQNAFEYFGGVPLKLKVDNMKTAILSNNQYDLEFNQDFLEFANHYNIVIKPCTPCKPNQKGKVESSIKYVKNNFMLGRTFKNLQDLNSQLRKWTDNYANNRIHGTTKRVPDEVFQQKEKECLQTLPENQYSFFNRSTRTVKSNCHISFNNNYYSVPHEFVKKEVVIRWNKYILRILYGTEEIAIHKINNGSGEYITIRNHLPKYKYYSQTEYQTKYELKMHDIGEYAHAYFKQLLIHKNNYWFRTVRIILGLCKIYGNSRVNLTLKRALLFNVLDIPTIKNICEKQTYLLEDPQILVKTNKGSNLDRNLSYYEQVYIK